MTKVVRGRRTGSPRSWHHRWWKRRLKCWFGRHGWMFGPADSNGMWVTPSGDHVPFPQEFTPYVCAFGDPWCRATKMEPRR